MNMDPDWKLKHKRKIITTELLGKAKIPNLPFVQPEGTSYLLDTDYFGKKRDADHPGVGPFESLKAGRNKLKIW
jgi:alpha-N-arabinofuranosidase